MLTPVNYMEIEALRLLAKSRRAYAFARYLQREKQGQVLKPTNGDEGVKGSVPVRKPFVALPVANG
jgi:hypothetical protein